MASTPGLCNGNNTEPPAPSLHAFTQHARLCPNACNSQKRKCTCESDFTARARASLSSSAAALEPDSTHHTTRRRRTQKSSGRIKSSVGTTIRGKHSQLITSRATVTTSRQLSRSCGSDPASLISCSTRRSTQMTLLSQSTPYNATPLATTRRNGLNGRTWNVQDGDGHNWRYFTYCDNLKQIEGERERAQ